MENLRRGWYELKAERIWGILSGLRIRKRSSTYFFKKIMSLGKEGRTESSKSLRVMLETSGARLLPIARPLIWLKYLPWKRRYPEVQQRERDSRNVDRGRVVWFWMVDQFLPTIWRALSMGILVKRDSASREARI